MLAEELGQLANLAVLIPTIFFGVAAFLLNLVLTRLIATQRQAIGTLKAFGYSRAAIAAHYAALVLLIAALGVVLGVAVGYGLGALISEVYAAFYRFPFLDYRLPGRVVAVAGGITAAVALAATLGAVLRAARLPPAQAMRPAAPPSFRATLVERLGLQRWLGQPTRIILRSLERRPLRTLLSVTGLACAVGILLIGPYQRGAIDTLIGVQFNLIQRDSVSVSFYEPTSRAALHELARLPGVDAAEPYRRVAAELIAGHRRHRLAVLGLAPGTSLRRLLDTGLREVAVPEQGVLLTAYLAERLGVAPGDPLEIRLLEGRRETVRVPVSGVIAEYLGVSAYMALETLNRLAGEGDAISGAWLAVADGRREAVLAELDRRPRVAGATESGAAMASFRDNIAESQRVTALMTTVLAAAIAFGVVYNNARIALSERSRELASLRVLGFTRGEIAYILLGEQALLIAAALPPGMLVGHALFAVIVRAAESELYRIPLIVSPAGMALAAAVVAGVGAVSAYVVRRRLDRLDLVEALKSRE
ncbi:hypothetical protein CKO13_11700 [Halorhodospira neutriphila]|uniref:ABC3 transporter permease C-terminal domain-containing protein n=2 Tax=Halorhodospira neutriphila TaxID=168379 RepID=A0ABS1E9B6_9GAMM|nr:hypothetical protein [Halorhodospira neutriphila]